MCHPAFFVTEISQDVIDINSSYYDIFVILMNNKY